MIHAPQRTRAQCSGLTLVEVMVAVSVSLIVIYVTFFIFNKVQKVWRTGRDSIHVLSTGRAVMDMVSADLARINIDSDRVGPNANFIAFNYRTFPVHTNMYTHRQHRSEVVKFVNSRVIFTTTRGDGGFDLNEYRLYSSTNAAAYNQMVVGTLYKSRPIPIIGTNWAYPQILFNSPTYSTNYSKVADGVVHFKVRAVSPRKLDPGRVLMENPKFSGKVSPTHVELELGILEDKLINEISGREPNFNLQREFITNHLDRVHIFRQLIPIKNRLP